jgi:hypothetical protein
MIYEVRTYRTKPRAVPTVMSIYGKAYEKRKKLSPLSAFFYTDVGMLNQIIHIWPYKDAADREKKRAESVKNKKYGWPPKIGEYLEEMQTEIYIPSPFTPEFPTGNMGPIFEWREYQVIPNMIPEVYKNWAKAIPKRIKMSPLVMAMHTESGGLNKFVHIWSYESMNHRMEVRAEAAAKGIWPPPGPRETLQIQTNKIVLAAPFSPLK